MQCTKIKRSSLKVVKPMLVPFRHRKRNVFSFGPKKDRTWRPTTTKEIFEVTYEAFFVSYKLVIYI